MTDVCTHCAEPSNSEILITILGGDRKLYDVVVCAGCYEALRAATPDQPSARGWHGIYDTPRLELP